MHLILPFLLIFITVSSIISIPTINQRNSFLRKGGQQDRLYYSPHIQVEKNCGKQVNVIPLDLLSHNKEGLITVVPPDFTQDGNDQHIEHCHNIGEAMTTVQYSETTKDSIEAVGFQFIKNGNFQSDRLPQFRYNQSFAANWIFNESFIVQGSKVFPKWTTQVGLIGIQCLSQLENSHQNRPYSIIQQSFELREPTQISLGFNFGLITLQNSFQRIPIEKTRLLWAHFNGQLAFSSQVTQAISYARLSLKGKKGKNILTFKSIRADFHCDSSEMIALDNITATKI